MKNQYYQKLSFLVILLLASSMSFAQQFVVNGVQYNMLTGTTNVEVIGNTTEYTGNITIPSTLPYNNVSYSVTSIGSSAFYGCSGLTSLTLPNSVTSIGSSAFYECTGLTSLTIPNSVTSIGEAAFNGCSGLTSLTIPNSVTSIGDGAFLGCSGLIRLIIPNSVTSIGQEAFYNCSGLTSLTLPNSVTSIGSWAFSSCIGLTSLTIPNSVTSIGTSAFQYCSGLTSLTIPTSVTSIGHEAFYNCTGLTSVTVDWATPLTIQDDVFFNGYGATLHVPAGTKAAYQVATAWEKFANITEIQAAGIETMNVSNFSISPNPATDNVTFTFTESVSGNVSIVDLQGNVLATKFISGKTTNISTADLSIGVYIVKIATDKGIAVKQLVIQ
jgi:hypothetical protein